MQPFNKTQLLMVKNTDYYKICLVTRNLTTPTKKKKCLNKTQASCDDQKATQNHLSSKLIKTIVSKPLATNLKSNSRAQNDSKLEIFPD